MATNIQNKKFENSQSFQGVFLEYAAANYNPDNPKCIVCLSPTKKKPSQSLFKDNFLKEVYVCYVNHHCDGNFQITIKYLGQFGDNLKIHDSCLEVLKNFEFDTEKNNTLEGESSLEIKLKCMKVMR